MAKPTVRISLETFTYFVYANFVIVWLDTRCISKCEGKGRTNRYLPLTTKREAELQALYLGAQWWRETHIISVPLFILVSLEHFVKVEACSYDPVAWCHNI